MKNVLKAFGIIALVAVIVLSTAACSKKNSGGKSSGKANPATDFRYDLNEAGDGVVITGYIGKGGDIVIPAEIEGMPVVEFRSNVSGGFADSDAYLKWILNKDEVGKQKAIKSGEVRKPITSIVFPDSMITFGTMSREDLHVNFGTFESCTELKSVVLPKKMDVIPGMFSNNLPKLVSVKMPETVEWIGPRAFAGCSALKSINIPDGVKSIDQEAFANCKSFTSIKIPDSVKKIGYGAFQYCSELSTIEINPHPITYYQGATVRWQLNSPYIDTENYAYAFRGTKLGLAERKKIQETGYKGVF